MAGSFALLAVFSLLFLMQSLIYQDALILTRSEPFQLPPFIRIAPNPLDDILPPEFIKPEPIEPAPGTENTSDLNENSVEIIDVTGEKPTGKFEKDWKLSMADTDSLFIVSVQPNYPSPAISRGIEGYAVVEYTVTEFGTTTNHKVIDAKPKK